MGVRTWIEGWPVYRQLTGTDPLGRGAAARSRPRTAALTPRTETADRVARSVCPYCAVGCGQRVYVKDEKVIQIEGDPDSPISRGRLCPKGSASKSLVTSPRASTKVLYRRPYGTEWEELDLDTAMDMIADRVLAARGATWEDVDADGRPLQPHAGHRQPRRRDAGQRGELPHQEAVHRDGRDPDREPGAYLTLRHGSRSGDLLRSWRGHRTSSRTWRTPTASSSRARTWPRRTRSGFQWVMEAKTRGAKVIHVDPRFTRTSALADLLRADPGRHATSRSSAGSSTTS